MSNVAKEEYWPTILEDLNLYGQITTEDTQFNSIAADLWKVMENSFIKSDDEETIIQWENTLGLVNEGLGDNERKSNILYTLTIKDYFPTSLFTQALNKLVGEGNYELEYEPENNSIVIQSLKKEVDFLSKRLVPSTINCDRLELPPGYLDAEFLESTGTQCIITGVAPFTEVLENIEVGMRVDAVILESNTWKYAAGMTSNSGNFGVSTPVRTGSNTLHIWFGTQQIRPAGSQERILSRFVHELNYKNSRKSVFKSYEGVQNYPLNLVNNSNYITDRSMMMFGIINQWGYKTYSSCRIWGAEFTNGCEIVRNYIPAISPSGFPCMYDKITKRPFYNSDTGSFTVGMDMKQARKLFKLPAGGGTLTVSLPLEAKLIQHNAEVESALETAKGNGWLVGVQYRDDIDDSDIYNKYTACQTVDEVKAVNAEYKKDLTADGIWIYPLDNLKNSQRMFQGSKCTGFKGTLPSLEDGANMFQELTMDSFDVDMPALVNMNGMFTSGKLESFSGNIDKVTSAGGTFNGTGLKHFSSRLPSLTTSGNMFTDCQLDKESVLLIAESIKTYKAGLTIGIDASLQNDDEVLEAIALIQEKRGSVTVQWNGTSTVSTYGLRRMPVYASMIDGVTGKEFEWGHYVTNWEKNGYLEFASVEEAEEYFGIEKETEQ